MGHMPNKKMSAAGEDDQALSKCFEETLINRTKVISGLIIEDEEDRFDC